MSFGDEIPVEAPERSRPDMDAIKRLYQATGVVSHAEAREIAGRYNASHWRQVDHERARYTIPADPRRDDDIRLSAFIDQAEETAKKVEQSERITESAVRALDSILHAVADASGFTGERDGDAEMLIKHVGELTALKAIYIELRGWVAADDNLHPTARLRELIAIDGKVEALFRAPVRRQPATQEQAANGGAS